MAEVSKTGVFYDTKNREVVDAEPEEGVQIVAPGGEMTEDVAADVQRYRDLAAGVVAEPGTVTSAAVSPKAKTPKADKGES